MLVKCLTENTACSDAFECEHGLSLYIETEGRKILFDTGQTSLFSRNAKTLGVDLKEVDTVVISHGHYDHGGGLKTFLEINDKAKIYLSEHAFEPHYHGREKYIGLDEGLKASPRLCFTKGVTKLGKGLTLFCADDKYLKYPVKAYGLSKLVNGKEVEEDFLHEQYLQIEEKGKRYLISGCSHRGILNIVNRFSPDVLIGGFHFTKLEPETEEGRKTLTEAAEELKSFDTLYYTCHCTGVKQYEYLKKILNDKLYYLSAGQTLNLN